MRLLDSKLILTKGMSNQHLATKAIVMSVDHVLPIRIEKTVKENMTN